MARDDYDDEFDDEEFYDDEEDADSLSGALAQQWGSAPWYVSSAGIHLVLFLVLLIFTPPPKPPEEPPVVVTTSIAEEPEPEPEEPPEPPEVQETIVEKVDIVVDPQVVAEVDVEVEVTEEVMEEPVQGDPSEFNELDSDVHSPAFMGIGAKGGAGGRGGKFGSRSGRGKGRALRRGGGSGTQDALDLALQWLAAHQEPAGNWDSQKYEGTKSCNYAVTGFALLAFLGNGNSTKFGKYKDNVKRAVEWGLAQQGADGHFGTFRYEAPILLMALAEAAGMEDYPEDNMRNAIQRAVDAACAAQGPDGGWRYSPNSNGDTSVAGWWMMALKSAKVAGFKIRPGTWDNAKKYFTAVGVRAGGDDYDPVAYGTYMAGNGKKTGICTAAMMCCRQFLGFPQDDPLIKGAANALIRQDAALKANFLPASQLGGGNGSQNFYLWYYQALGFFQLGTASEYWKDFNPRMKKELLTTQRKDTTVQEFRGSWDCNNGHNFHGGDNWGRVGQTAIGALMLEVYYRYASVHKKGRK